MPDKRANRGRIYHLEYELGFRDDPPGPSDEPGAVRYYNPSPSLTSDPDKAVDTRRYCGRLGCVSGSNISYCSCGSSTVG